MHDHVCKTPPATDHLAPAGPAAKRQVTLSEYSMNEDKKKKLDMLLTTMVVATNSSFSIVDHPAFVAFVKALNPKYVVPCRQTVSGTLLDQLYEVGE